jgi:dUTPase
MAERAKVFIVDHDYQADYKVCFVDQSYQEKNAALIAGGELVDHDYQADVKVFIVDQEYKADIKIMRKNFPKK